MVFGPFTADQTGGFFRVRTVQPGADPGQPELHIARNKTGGIEVRFHGEAGVLYRLETTGNVAAGNWEPLAIRTGDGRDIILGPFTTRRLAGFYRVQTVQPEFVPGPPRLNLQRVAGGVEVRFNGEAGVTYRLERTERFPASGWHSIVSRVSVGEEIVFGPFPTSGPAGFFRVQVE